MSANTVDFHMVMQAYTQEVMYPYQRRWMRSILTSPRTAILACRQVGKSWTLALASIILAHVDRQDILIISESRDKATNIIREIGRHLDRIGRAMGGPIHDPRRSGSGAVTLLSGRTITARPGQPKALQGFTGTVLVDELSITRHPPEELLAQALSVSSSSEKYRVIVCSNADKQDSFVHRFFFPVDDEHARWSIHHDDIYSCLGIEDRDPANLPPRFQSIRASMNRRIWRRFYENQFLASGTARFDIDEIPTILDPHRPKQTVTIGYDPAYTINPSGVVVLGHDVHEGEPRAQVLDAQKWYQVPVAEQVDRIVELVKEYHAHRVVIDKGGAEAIIQALRPRLGRRLVEVSVTDKFQTTQADTIDYLISTGGLIVPSSALRAEISTIETDDGHRIHLPTTIPYPRPNEKAKDHADMYCALALASTQVSRPRPATYVPTTYLRQAGLHRPAQVSRTIPTRRR